MRLTKEGKGMPEEELVSLKRRKVVRTKVEVKRETVSNLGSWGPKKFGKSK